MFEIISLRRAGRAVSSVPAILKAFALGRTCTLALKDESFPYAVTVSYVPCFCENELFLIIHGSREGRKATLLGREPCLALTVTLQDRVNMTGDCRSSNCYQSLCAEALAEELHGLAALEGLTELMYHHGAVGERSELQKRLAPLADRTAVWRLKILRAALKRHA